MPRSCASCEHPQRAAIDRALASGASNRATASLYGVSESAVRRHKANHLPATLAKAYEAEEASHAGDLLRQVRALQDKTLNILLRAEGSGELRTAVSAVREARRNVELLARLSGEIDERPVNVLISPEWIALRTVIVGALEPYSDARGAVLRAIEGAGNGRP
jgi:adenine-specific DNA methylase